MQTVNHLSSQKKAKSRFFHFALGTTFLLFIMNIYIIFGDEEFTKSLSPKKAEISLKLPGLEEKSLSLFDLLFKQAGQSLSSDTASPLGNNKRLSPAELKNTFEKLINKIKSKAYSLIPGSILSSHGYKAFAFYAKTMARNIKEETKKYGGCQKPSQTKVTISLGQGRRALGTSRTAQTPAIPNPQQQIVHQGIAPLGPNPNRRPQVNWGGRGIAPNLIQTAFNSPQSQTPARLTTYQFIASPIPSMITYGGSSASLTSSSIINRFAVHSDAPTQSSLANPRIPRFPFQIRAAADGGKKLHFEHDDRDPPSPMGGVASGSPSPQQAVTKGVDFPNPLAYPAPKIPNPFGLREPQKAEAAKPQEIEKLKTQPKPQYTTHSNVKTPARNGIASDYITPQPLNYPKIPNFRDLFGVQEALERTPEEVKHTNVRTHPQVMTVVQNSSPLRIAVGSGAETPPLLGYPPRIPFGLLTVRKSKTAQHHFLTFPFEGVTEPQGPSSSLSMSLLPNTQAQPNTNAFGKVLRIHVKHKGSQDVIAYFDMLFEPTANTYATAPSQSQKAFMLAFDNYIRHEPLLISDAQSSTYIPHKQFNIDNILSHFSSKASNAVRDTANRALDSMGVGKIICIRERGNGLSLEMSAQEYERTILISPSRFITITNAFRKAFLPDFFASLRSSPLIDLRFDVNALGSLLKLVKEEVKNKTDDLFQVGKIISFQEKGKAASKNEKQTVARVEEITEPDISTLDTQPSILASQSIDQETAETQSTQATHLNMTSFDDAAERVNKSLEELKLAATRAKSINEILRSVENIHIALGHLTQVGGQIKKENSHDQKGSKKIDRIIKELEIKTNKSIYGSLRDKLPAETIGRLLANKQKRRVRDLQSLFQNPLKETTPKSVSESPSKIITTLPSEAEIRELTQNIINGLSQTIGRASSKTQKRSTVYQLKTGIEITELPKKNQTLPRNFYRNYGLSSYERDCFGAHDPLCSY